MEALEYFTNGDGAGISSTYGKEEALIRIKSLYKFGAKKVLVEEGDIPKIAEVLILMLPPAIIDFRLIGVIAAFKADAVYERCDSELILRWNL